MKIKNIIIIFIIHLFIFISLCGNVSNYDRDVFTDKVFNDKIRTVQLYREGWNLSYPVIKLKSDEKLVLHFDLLDNQSEGYYYTFIHCDKDWKESGIFINDYLNGYEENPLEDIKASFNTTVHYFHYKLTFPNERVQLLISGNYIISIHQPGQKDDPVITRRFIITEDAAKIGVDIHRPQMTNQNNTHQQVDFTVNFAGLRLEDPYRNVYAFILQNGRWGDAKKNLKPDFYGNNELKYNSLSVKNIFPGGNEYRYFDIKSIRYQSEFVMAIEFSVKNYNVFLKPSEIREDKPYFYWKDFNGKYFIAYQEGRDPDIDADYVYVYFTLTGPEKAGDIYISGAMNGWKFDRNNLMSYSSEKKHYEGAMLLKQGWYNYEYVLLSGKNDPENIPLLLEGDHYETENDYTILVYYRNPRERYDRVIGAVTANTLNRLSR